MSSFDVSPEEPITDISQFKSRVFQTIYLDKMGLLQELIQSFKGLYDLKGLKDAVGNTGTPIYPIFSG
jgi:hypothetical protein